MKYRVRKTIEFDIVATVEAEDTADAERELDLATADCTIEASNIMVTDCSENSSEMGETVNLSAEKWETMSVLARANLLKENGAGDDDALEIADENDLERIPEEYQGCVEA